ncbi:MAG: pyridoxal-phosphate dependent enzyme [Hyphomicrobiales bacterium]|nr:pyridoxal-phosphate dependent enzyme [Hyphomicrobiales bacterium]
MIDNSATDGPLIVNTLGARRPDAVRRGDPGNAVFQAADGRAVIPWTPLFEREPPLWRPPSEILLRLGGADVMFWNDSSGHSPIYGNKARKYEFLLANLHWAKVQRTATMGAVSSNHVLQFALANRMADLTGSGDALESEVNLILFEVPDAPTDQSRLTLLEQLSKKVVVTSNKIGLAGEIARELAVREFEAEPEAIIPPGGSNELSALGHMNAIAELALALEAMQDWREPPDMIFVPMGSGSTVLGLILGVRLLGWRTKIVGVADQDMSYVSRLVANQQPSTPFVEGNVARLAAKTIAWLQAIKFPGIDFTTDELLRTGAFLPDSTSWAPGYGLVEASDEVWRDRFAAAGVKLDPVFTLKAWRSLTRMAESGALKGKRVIFWNTYNAFDYASLGRAGTNASL